jgi:hypothetical protein
MTLSRSRGSRLTGCYPEEGILETSRTFCRDLHPLKVLGLRYVIWESNKGRKGVVYVYLRYAHMAER